MTKIGRRLGASRLGWLAGAAALLLTGVTAPPAHAVNVPAYGTIIVSADFGGGPEVTWTYTTGQNHEDWICNWDLYTNVWGIPYQVIAWCKPNDWVVSYICPLMILTTQTSGGSAGGRVRCNTTVAPLDTGVVTGRNAKTKHGNLGSVARIECIAYVEPPAVLVAPYSVTCAEPGLPTL